MKVLDLFKKLVKRKPSHTRSHFAERQFEELARRNLSIPVKLFHL